MQDPHVRIELTKPAGICEALAEARTTANLTSKDLAVRLAWPASRISKLELGQQMPTAADLYAWLRACNVAPQHIQELQTELERIRVAYPGFHRKKRLADLGPEVGSSPALQAAYNRGYADAIAEMRANLVTMETSYAVADEVDAQAENYSGD